MKKFVCSVCGYVHEGDKAPDVCPVCGAPASKFIEQGEEMSWAAEHVVGVAQGAPEDILEDLRANFQGECSEVGMYLAMARVAHREGYPEIGLYWEKAAWEEAEHAAKFAELLGEVLTDSTKKNLEMRVEAENGATAGKTDLAKRAKALNLDAIHDTVHERDMARLLPVCWPGTSISKNAKWPSGFCRRAFLLLFPAFPDILHTFMKSEKRKKEQGVTPQEFFSTELLAPQKAKKLQQEIEKLTPAQADHIFMIIRDILGNS